MHALVMLSRFLYDLAFYRYSRLLRLRCCVQIELQKYYYLSRGGILAHVKCELLSRSRAKVIVHTIEINSAIIPLSCWDLA